MTSLFSNDPALTTSYSNNEVKGDGVFLSGAVVKKTHPLLTRASSAVEANITLERFTPLFADILVVQGDQFQ